jgi:RNA polymerase sigma-70 factor (ECF subfamily)
MALLEAEPLEESVVNEAMKNLIWDTPEQANRLLKRSTIEKVQAAIRTLPKPLKEIIKLHDIEGLDYDVISRILGITKNNAKSRTHRARTELRKKLENVKDDLEI